MFSSLFVSLSICLFVCLLVTLQKNFPADLNETFRECWQWADEQVVKFWWQSWSPSGYGDCFPDSSLLGDTESVINRLRCATLHCRASSTSRYRHSNYEVITCWSICSKALAAKLIICYCFFRVCCSPAMANSIKAHAEKPLLLFWLTMSGCQSKLFFSICRQLAWSGWPGAMDRRQLRSVATINQNETRFQFSAWESKHALFTRGLAKSTTDYLLRTISDHQYHQRRMKCTKSSAMTACARSIYTLLRRVFSIL